MTLLIATTALLIGVAVGIGTGWTAAWYTHRSRR